MTSFSIMALLISFGVFIYIEFRFRSPYVALPIFLSLVVLLPHISNIIINQLDDALLNKATVYIVLFNLFYCFYRLFFKKLVLNYFNWFDIVHQTKVYSSRKFQGIKFTYLILGLLAMLMSIYAAIGSFDIFAALRASWWDFVQAKPQFKLPALYIIYFLCCLPVVAIIRKDKTLLILSVLLVLFYIIVLRTRGSVIAYILPLLVFYLYVKVRNPKQIFYLFIGSMLVIGVFVFTREVRLAGGVDNLLFGTVELSDVVKRNFTEGGEFVLINAFYASIDKSYDGFFEGQNLIRTMLLPIPSFLSLGLKPDEFTYIVWDFYNGKSVTGAQSFHPTLYGLAYMDLGWLGVFFYPLFINFVFVFFELILTRIRGYLQIHLITLMMITGMVMARGSFYNSIAFAFWPILLCFLLYVLSIMKFKKGEVRAVNNK